jgi:anti-sigma regulatory factor (Ser/Thr protein kinase)
VTELVSNAITHACGEGMRVTVVSLSECRVRVAVIDQDRTRPQLKPPTPDRERGRGLLLVHALSDTWGVELLPGGKRVWAELKAS